MSYKRYFCLLAYSGVQHILCFVFLRLVYPMLPVSLDCSFVCITPAVFSNVYAIPLYYTNESVILGSCLNREQHIFVTQFSTA